MIANNQTIDSELTGLRRDTSTRLAADRVHRETDVPADVCKGEGCGMTEAPFFSLHRERGIHF